MLGVAERVAPGQPERNFHAEAANRLDAGQLRPCRTADSISPIPPSLPSSVRAYNYRRHANPGTLLARERKGEGEAYDFSFSRLYSAFSPPLSFTFGLRGRIPIPGRRLDLPRARVPTRPHAGGATVPHYHTIFMLAPPGPQSCTTKHYT